MPTPDQIAVLQELKRRRATLPADKVAIVDELSRRWEPISSPASQPTEQAAPQESPGFFTGLREGLGIPGSLQEAKSIVTGLAEPTGNIVADAMPGMRIPYNLGRAALQAQGEQLSKAKTALSEGHYSEAFGHGLAGVTPLVGPAAAGAGEVIGQGQFARGAGQATGMLAPFANLERFLKTGKLTEAVLAEKAAAPPAIRKTLGERIGSPGLQKVEGIVERTIPATSVFKKFRAAQQLDLQKYADRVVKTISDFDGTPEELGGQVVKVLDAKKASLKEQIGKQYAAIDKASADVRPSTRPLKAFAREQMSRLQKEAQLIPPQELQRTTAILKQILKSPDTLPFSAFHDARSDLLGIARSYGDPIPGKAGGLAKQLAKLSDESMMTAAEKSGNPDLVRAIRDANSNWRGLTEAYNDSIIKRILDDRTAAEKIPAIVEKASLEDIRTIKRLAPERFPDIAAQIIRDKLLKSTENELTAPLSGAVGEQIAPSVSTPAFKATSFRRELEKLGEHRLRELLPPTQARELMHFLNEAERIGVSSSNLVSGAINGYLLFGGVQAISHGPGALMTPASIYAATNLLARGLVSQPQTYLPALKNLARAMASKNASQIEFWSQRVGQMLSEQEQRQQAAGRGQNQSGAPSLAQ